MFLLFNTLMSKIQKKKINDYTIIKEKYDELGLIDDILDNVKPNISTCNQLIHSIMNDRRYTSEIKIANIHHIINYVETNSLAKDRSYYNIVIQTMEMSEEPDKQCEMIQEMKDKGFKLKTSLYVPVIRTYYQSFCKHPTKEKYNMAFKIANQIVLDGFDMDDEVFQVLFKTMQFVNDCRFDIDIKKDTIDTLNKMSYYLNTIEYKTFRAYTDFIKSFKNKVAYHGTYHLKFETDDYKEHNLKQRNIDGDVYIKLRDDWLQLFDKSDPNIGDTLRKCANNFKFHNKKFLDISKPTVLIDAGNVGYAVNRKRGNKINFYRQNDAFVQHFHKLGYNVIIFIYYKHLENIADEEIRNIVDSWKQPFKNIIRYDVKGCNDDYIWMYASFYYNSVRPNHNTYILSNDIMRNPNLENLNQRDFQHFQQKHQITYDIKYSYDPKLGYDNSTFTFDVYHPIPYSHCTQIYKRKFSYVINVPYTENNIKKNEKDTKLMDPRLRFKQETESVIWHSISLDFD